VTLTSLRPRPRDLLVVAGVLSIGAGVAVCVWTGLGVGPIDVLLVALAQRAGGSFTAVVAPALAALALVAVALGGRIGPATVIAPVAVGPTIDAALWALAPLQPPAGLALLGATQLAATALLGAGGAAILLGRRGPAVIELLAGAIAHRAHIGDIAARTTLEATLLGVGWALGGPVGVGTIIVAVGSGPAVRLSENLAGRAGLTR
jgi:uncharacterized membrane protein YczE